MVKPKKHLGQHFLKDKNIAGKIVGAMDIEKCRRIIEVGPGTGILTDIIFNIPETEYFVIEIDKESIEYLKEKFKDNHPQIIEGDFLKTDSTLFMPNSIVIGNFPYNISSQIFFKVLKEKDSVTEVIGMIQKEVAERIKAGPGSKTYGILSVLLQTYYEIEYLFTVNESVFIPPPKVKSAVIRLRRNSRKETGCDEKLLFEVVKAAFNQRRKTMRNSLKNYIDESISGLEVFSKRPEQLSVEEFIILTQTIEKIRT